MSRHVSEMCSLERRHLFVVHHSSLTIFVLCGWIVLSRHPARSMAIRTLRIMSEECVVNRSGTKAWIMAIHDPHAKVYAKYNEKHICCTYVIQTDEGCENIGLVLTRSTLYIYRQRVDLSDSDSSFHPQVPRHRPRRHTVLDTLVSVAWVGSLHGLSSLG